MRRIHGCNGPVSDADGQEEKGDDGVEESGHDVANGPRNSKDQKLCALKKVLNTVFKF